MQEGLQQAVGVPLALAEKISILWPLLREMVIYGNIACKSDAQVHKDMEEFSYVSVFTSYSLLCVCVCFCVCSQVAAKALETAVFGAYYNVIINLKDITDEAFKIVVSAPMCFLRDVSFNWILNPDRWVYFVMQTQTRAAVLLQEAKESAAAILRAAEERNWRQREIEKSTNIWISQ